jgi:hypothetical protein
MRSERESSLRLILRWVRQGAFVLEDLSKVTAGPSIRGRQGGEKTHFLRSSSCSASFERAAQSSAIAWYVRRLD